MKMELMIENQEGKIFLPLVCDGISWETERKGVPGKLTFRVLKDEVINFLEGSRVTFRVNDKPVFYGFVFTKSRDRDQIISVVAYDQLRYFKNKDVFFYKEQTASEVLASLAKDFKLILGTVEDTEHEIPQRYEDNVTLFDIVQYALDETYTATQKRFVLFDDFGKIALKSVEDMKVLISIQADTAENFSYSSSIDSNTYNKIKLYHDDKEGGEREVYISPSDKTSDDALRAEGEQNQKDWGILQECEKYDPKQISDPQKRADDLLKLKNKKRRSLSIQRAIGDLRVRAGSSVFVSMLLGDIEVNDWMTVEKVTHQFADNEHFMNLEVTGGLIGAE